MIVTPCCNPIVVPGPKGATGLGGTDGTDGANAYSVLAASFTMPAIGAGTAATVNSSAWAFAGIYVWVQYLGLMSVSAVGDSTHITLVNTGYSGNAAAGTTAPVGSKITASGPQGPSGSLTGAAGGVLNGTYPNPTFAATVLSVAGDLIAYNGTNAVRLAQGGANTFLGGFAGVGMPVYRAVNIATADVTGILPIANGGTNAAAAPAARTNLGLGTIATQAANAVAITGGSISGITDLAIADGGTGASTASAARTALGVDKCTVNYALFQDQQTSGTSDGDFNSGDWRKRTLNTTVVDTLGTFSLGSSQITIPAGTYRFRVMAPAYQVDNHQVKLKNVTDGIDYFGVTVRSGASDEVQTISIAEGRFTIAVPKVFEVQHRCVTSKATSGFGLASSFGNVEVYASALFEREAN